ncbi:MAG: ATP-binding cassette domain-containing protein [Alphaproteobacteria bacterium]|nr:ATP-binding cassette domain-containing protein [Alphaproteobacteria bacterium]
MLSSTHISIARRGSPELHFPDLDIQPGQRTLLLGPSGCGKTTWLSVLAGLLAPQGRGKVSFEGRDIYALSPRARDHLRGRHFGFVFQTLHLLPTLDLRSNIALAADMAGAARDEARIDRLLQTLDLSQKARRKPDALSQGEQQRAAIARAVLNGPKIIMADEPTSALDDANAEAVMNLLGKQAQETGAALLIATHDNRITHHFENIVRLEDPHPAKEAA